MLEYSESTLRTGTQFFNDARALAVTGVQYWPPDFAVSVADIHLWTHTRSRVVAQVDCPAIGHLYNHGHAAVTSERTALRRPNLLDRLLHALP